MAKTMKKHKSYDINYKDHPLKDFDTLLSVYGTKKILIIMIRRVIVQHTKIFWISVNMDMRKKKFVK